MWLVWFLQRQVALNPVPKPISLYPDRPFHRQDISTELWYNVKHLKCPYDQNPRYSIFFLILVHNRSFLQWRIKNPWNGCEKPSFHILNFSNVQMRCSTICISLTTWIPGMTLPSPSKQWWDEEHFLDRVKCTGLHKLQHWLGARGKEGGIKADHVNCPKSFYPIVDIFPNLNLLRSLELTYLGLYFREFTNAIDPFHKWLPVINSFVIIKISLTNLVFELIIQKNCYSQTSLVRLI